MASTDQSLDPVIFSRRQKRKSDSVDQMLMLQQSRKRVFQINKILKKAEDERSSEECLVLETYPDLVKKAVERATIRCKLKRREMEIEDSSEVLLQKCNQLAEAIKKSKGICVYTGAGISTAASIPDYRGPNGVWTLLQKGHELKPQQFTDAEPTKTHMGILTLYTHGKLKHVVSQNCDGLHLRSGLSKRILSEVHGNMYLEMCYKCKPMKEYLRLFDVTEKTGVRRHNTARRCHYCKNPLSDTIVHFGEKGRLCSPYRWKEAAAAAKTCDVILCLGTSLKVLKKYACLWCMDRKPSKRPKLFIVNLQWTPKDDYATLKINGKCDDVMDQVMNRLGWTITEYLRETDPMFRFAVPLRPHEYKTTTAKHLKVPDCMKEKFHFKWKKAKSEPSLNKYLHPAPSAAVISSVKAEAECQYPCPQEPSLPSHLERNVLYDVPNLPNTFQSMYEDTNLKLTLKNDNMCSCRIVDSSECTVCFLKNSCDKDHSYSRRQQQQASSPQSFLEIQKTPFISLQCCSVGNILMEHDYLGWTQYETLFKAAGFVVKQPSTQMSFKAEESPVGIKDRGLSTDIKENGLLLVDSKYNSESCSRICYAHQPPTSCSIYSKSNNNSGSCSCSSSSSCCYRGSSNSSSSSGGSISSSSSCNSSGSSSNTSSSKRSNCIENTKELLLNTTSQTTTTATTSTTTTRTIKTVYCVSCFYNKMKFSECSGGDQDRGSGHAGAACIKSEPASDSREEHGSESALGDRDSHAQYCESRELYGKSQARSVPGWFGKGLNVRKKKRRF
ncbi:NAD-dependent protein deacetylase sirtuin-7-like [Argonauta hians]